MKTSATHPSLGFAFLALLAFHVQIQAQTSVIRGRVVYGQDDRLDYYQVQDPQVKRSADATVALIRTANLDIQGPITKIVTVPYGQNMGLCPEEPFFSQETSAFCSGFLVSPDLVVTAGHCVSSQENCVNTRFVFDFKLSSANDQPRSVPTDRVFNCSKLIHAVSLADGEDFAVVQLDRPVTHVAPLNLRGSGDIAIGEPVTVMGYPEGLPLKVAAGANVRNLQPQFFQANLDTFAGNSGSAVINSNSGLVEGVLVRGERDFEMQNGCRVSKRCLDNACRGEDVTRIERVLPYLHP